MGSNKPRDIDYGALHRRYLQGETGMAIAADVGIKWSGLYRAWDRLGLPRRSGSAAALLRDPAASRQTILLAQAAIRGRPKTLEARLRGAATRERKMLGTSAGEDRIALMFDAIGVAYVRQKAIGTYNVDFAFPDHGIVLEVSGGGHNPRVRSNAAHRQAFIESQGWSFYETSTKIGRRHDSLDNLLRMFQADVDGKRETPLIA